MRAAEGCETSAAHGSRIAPQRNLRPSCRAELLCLMQARHGLCRALCSQVARVLSSSFLQTQQQVLPEEANSSGNLFGPELETAGTGSAAAPRRHAARSGISPPPAGKSQPGASLGACCSPTLLLGKQQRAAKVLLAARFAPQSKGRRQACTFPEEGSQQSLSLI